ncbi:outer membrane autotransporter barrel domain protein [Mitsuokella sp. oral taxon 131 str. W9106]|nr:outer membrane autotransporter barrel domain protein [Mitsuokella sp. oral taxon 131 str. W9106]
MRKGTKRYQKLAVCIALALSTGGGTFLLNPTHALAADVTGGDVTVDAAHPLPATFSLPAGNGADIPNTGDNRNVVGNKLTIRVRTGYVWHYGGYTAGSGNATGNILTLSGELNSGLADLYFVGGGSEHGNATGNTVILEGPVTGNYLYLYGGRSNLPAGDATTGNTLRVKGGMTSVIQIRNFEKMEYDLDSSVANGAGMLYVSFGLPSIDWNKVGVNGLSKWAESLPSTINTPNVVLYNTGSSNISLRNYSPRLIQAMNHYEFGIRGNGTLAGTTMAGATQITLSGNKYEYATTPTVVGATAHGGYSLYGNTTNHNTITISPGAYSDVRAGYTDAEKGGSEYNTLKFEPGTSSTNAYAGFSRATQASDADRKADASAKANAKKNVAEVSGGAITNLYGGALTGAAASGDATGNAVKVSGGAVTNLYGGALTDAAATGNATGNTVTITGGTLNGDVYGGHTAGTGKTTGNTVNLGDEDGAYSAATAVNGTLYGGSDSADVAGNVLNVNANAQAKNIRNFETIRFNFKPTQNAASPLLRLTDTAGTALDWRSIKTTGNAIGDGRIVTLLENTTAGGLTIGSYTGAKEVASTGTSEISIDTDTHAASAKKILFRGYTFRDASKTAGASDATTPASDVWAGRSAIGNTTAGSHLTVTGGTFRDAYGGWTAGTTTTAADKFGSRGNSVTLKDTDAAHPTEVRSLYGGRSETPAGSATGNKAIVAGGTVTGTIYGGALTDAAATGSATGNTVTITGGRIGTPLQAADVYGGYTAGSGKTTGNTVTLGDGTHGVGTIYGTLYGGSDSADVTGNTLVVKANAGAAVKGIQNFETIRFDMDTSASTTTPLLNVTGTMPLAGLDWAKVDVDVKHLSPVLRPYEAYHAHILEGAGGISFMQGSRNTYVPIGAKDKRNGNYEFVLDTDTHSVNATRYVDLTGCQYQNNKAAKFTAADGTKPEAWAGRSIAGNTVQHNVLSVEGGTLVKAVGGIAENTKHDGAGVLLTTGDANDNTVTVKAGAAVHDAYGADVRTKGGSAEGNAAEVTGSTVAGNVYGGALTAAGATGAAKENVVRLKGGTVTGTVYGGALTDAAAVGAATGNVVNILGGQAQDIYAGFTAGTGRTTGNIVNIGDGAAPLAAGTSVSGTIYGGNGTDVEGNTLNIKTKGLTAGSVANFEHITFMPNAQMADGDTVLTLTRNTVIPIGSLCVPTEHMEKWLGNAVEKGAHLIRMTGASLTVNGYGTAADTKRAGDVEYQLRTDDDAAVTTGTLDISAYRWRNANITASTAAADAYAGKSRMAETESNHLSIAAGGAVTNAIAGDTQSAMGDAKGNVLTVTDGALAHGIGGKAIGGAAVKNAVVVNGGAIGTASAQGALYGAMTQGEAHENRVAAEGGTVHADLCGARAAGSATKNTVTVASSMQGRVTGAESVHADATENTVSIKAAVTGDVFGGRAAQGSASQNAVTVEGASVTGDVTGGAGATTTGNAIHLRGAAVTGDVIGGTAGAAGNTLAIHFDPVRTSSVHDFRNVENLHFYLGGRVNRESPTMLQLGVRQKDMRGMHLGVGVNGAAPALQMGDVISLMKAAPGGTLTMDALPQNHVEGMQGVSLLYGFDLQKRGLDELVATVTKAAISERTKSLVETRAGMSDFLNRGADLLTWAGVQSAGKEGGTKRYELWAAMQNGSMRARTGSYVDSNGMNLALGWARRDPRGKGKTTFSPFVEYGKGKYTSHLDDGTTGSGDLSYFGAGVLGTYERPDGLWADASVHAGMARSDYRGQLYGNRNTTYDMDSAYYAAHLGVGKNFRCGAGSTVGAYLRYLYSNQQGGEATLSSGETYDFGSVHSNRVRLGATYAHMGKRGGSVRAGLAWEYELSGSARASYAGYDTPSPSLRGGSAMLELGYRFAPKDGRVRYDFQVTGWQGRREGVSGSVQVNWAF